MKNKKIPTESLIIHVQSEPKYISYLNGIFEGYEWLAIIRTTDPKAGIMALISSPDLEDDLRKILIHLKQEMGLKILD